MKMNRKVKKWIEQRPNVFRFYIIALKCWQTMVGVTNVIRYGSRVARSFIIDYDKKVIFLLNNKCACTSILNAMGVGWGTKHISRREKPTTGVFIKHDLSEWEQGFFIFTIVRNPYDRQVSLFENQYNGNAYRYRDKERAWQYGAWRDKWFDYFIWEVLKSNRFNIDEHVKPLYDQIYKNGKCLANSVIKMENLSESWKPISKKYGYDELKKLNSSGRDISTKGAFYKSKVKSGWKDYYTDYTADMVYKYYENDFKTFGYGDCYRDLKVYIKENKSIESVKEGPYRQLLDGVDLLL